MGFRNDFKFFSFFEIFINFSFRARECHGFALIRAVLFFFQKGGLNLSIDYKSLITEQRTEFLFGPIFNALFQN